MIFARAPMRLSFAGGGTDVDEFAYRYGGCVVSTTIARYVRVSMQESKEPRVASYPLAQSDYALISKLAAYFKPVSMDVRVDAPPSSGLGASGALSVAVIGALNTLKEEEPLTLPQIAALAHDLEVKEMGIAGGRQDQVASCHGGLNYIEFGHGRINVTRIDVKPETLYGLETSLILVFTRPRQTNSGSVMAAETKRIDRADERTLAALMLQKEIANEMRRVLRRGLLRDFGALLAEAWQIKKVQTPEATDQAIDDLYEEGVKAGAIGGKISGAGGGGYLTLFAPGREGQVAERMLSLGFRPETVVLDPEGLKVWQL